jgi:hypothetical protein
VNITCALRSGPPIVLVPDASVIPKRNRFGPTMVSDEMIRGTNGTFPPTVDGAADRGPEALPAPPLGALEPPPDVLHPIARTTTETSATNDSDRFRGCTAASYPPSLIPAVGG